MERAGEPPQIFLYMPFRNQPNRHQPPGGQLDGASEQFLAQPDPLGVMVDRPMPHVANDPLGRVQELLDLDVIFRLAAPFLLSRHGMEPRSHPSRGPSLYAIAAAWRAFRNDAVASS